MKLVISNFLEPGQRVLVRASLNVSLDKNGGITDVLRLRRTIETIKVILAADAIPILLSHIENDYGSTLQPVVEWFKDQGFRTELVKNYFPYNSDIKFESDILYIFENLRDYPGEKDNDLNFSKALAEYGDIYVNESFDSAHRSHASTVTLPSLLPSYAGINFAREVSELSKVFSPDRPFLFIIGGAKFETKAPLIKELLTQADEVFVGGALMNPLLHASGFEIGSSIMPDDEVSSKDILSSTKLHLPIDFINQDHLVIDRDGVASTDQLLDIGPESVEELSAAIENAGLVVWNGPLGNYEAGFSEATDTIIEILANSEAYSIIGGGDTLAAISDELESKIDWISTGGGAMLDFIESGGDLPAIKALG